VAARRLGPLALLEAATLVSGTGNAAATVALPWLVLERTGSATAAGLVAAGTVLPLLVASLLSGTVVDLVGRRRTAVISDALSCLAVAAIPLVDATVGLSVGVLVALAALGSVFDPAGITARETLLPAAASAAGWRLERANSVHEAVWGVAFLAGPGVGGVLIATVGAASTLWVTAAGFAVSLVLIAAVRLPGASAPAAHERPAGFWRGTGEGLAFVWGDPVLRATCLLTMAVVALYLPVEGIVLPVYFTGQGAPERLGVVIMGLSVGGIIGALAYGQWGRHFRRRTAFVVALVGVGLPLLGMATLPSFPVMVVLAVLTGGCYGPIAPLTNYAMQTRTPEQLRGRVMGVVTSSEYAAGPAGYLLGGPLVEALGVRPAFLLLTGALFLVALAAVPARGLRSLDDPPRYAASPDAPLPMPPHRSVPFGDAP
jgi:MFS family permease